MTLLGTLLGTVLPLAVASAQQGSPEVVRQKRAPSEDNAAKLYELAIVELDRGLRVGKDLLPASFPHGLIIQPGRMILPSGTEAELAEKVAQAIADSVLMRALFVQAAARSTCTLSPVDPERHRIRMLRMGQLLDLMEMHANAVLAEQPVAACDDACAMLQCARHLQLARCAPAVVGEDPQLAVLRIQKRALSILDRALPAVCREPRWSGNAPRYEAILRTCSVSMADHEQFARIYLDGIPALVELHRARLRDMHMHVAGGFDQEAMVRSLQATVAAVVKRPVADQVSFAAWCTAIDQRRLTALQPPAERASVTEKATYGMAQLALISGNGVGEAIRENAQLLERCREAIQLAVKPGH